MPAEDLVLNPALCANSERTFNDSPPPCLEPANKICQSCHLVVYCSRECQVAHWSKHKLDCHSPLTKDTWKQAWDTERRQLAFSLWTRIISFGRKKYLWGSTPAVDILNLKQNEGGDIFHDISLLFAASVDIRNVVKTLVALPETYPGRCQVVVNDRDFDVVARNAILLLTAFHLLPKETTPTLIHIWYSVLIPARMLQRLQEVILPLIENVCRRIASKPENQLLSKAWSSNRGTLRLVLAKRQWDCLREYLKVPAGLSVDEAQRMRTSIMLAPDREDHLHHALYAQRPAWRLCTLRFRSDGILLPYGSSREQFDTPNPTFFRAHHAWPMLHAADPLHSWELRDIVGKTASAKNDVYGSLFFYLRKLLLDFC